MKTYEQTQSAVADYFAVKVFGFEDDPNEENESELKGFIENISLSKEELAAFFSPARIVHTGSKAVVRKTPNVRTQ